MTSKFIQLFPPELRTASVVPRWSVVWTLTRDTVANHSYYVAMYARSVAKVVGWGGSYALLLFLALTHDLDETITGDIVSPVKDEILDEQRAADYVDVQMQQRLPGIVAEIDAVTDCGELNTPSFNMAKLRQCDEAWRIIKVADRLDALLFLIGEQRMGNGVIAPRIPSAEARLYSAWMELPKTQQELQALWQTVMLPAIKAHREEGGNGV
jgi:5'-deoxynucleotidase YfbR-like HD superfamily hydrolase